MESGIFVFEGQGSVTLLFLQALHGIPVLVLRRVICSLILILSHFISHWTPITFAFPRTRKLM